MNHLLSHFHISHVRTYGLIFSHMNNPFSHAIMFCSHDVIHAYTRIVFAIIQEKHMNM